MASGELSKPPFSYLSPDQINTYEPVELGTGGFCFLVAEMLKEKHPHAEFWRLTNRERTKYSHVFVRVDGKPCDIKGFRSVAEMRFDLNDYGLAEEITDPKEIKNYFYHWYSTEQLAAARAVLRKAIFR